MTAEDRAKAVVAYFPAIPQGIRPQVEAVITRGIKRAVNQQLAQLELLAEKEQRLAGGRGKQAKGRDEAAVHFHGWWATKFRALRTKNPVQSLVENNPSPAPRGCGIPPHHSLPVRP